MLSCAHLRELSYIEHGLEVKSCKKLFKLTTVATAYMFANIIYICVDNVDVFVFDNFKELFFLSQR